ncbi:MAG: MBL fold metallo-hydrolase [Janthinobacterium lividum]
MPQTWKIGSTSITRIEEQIGPNDSPAASFLPNLVRERFTEHLPWMVPTHYLPESDSLITSNHSWLIRTGRHTILLDSCAGNHKPRPWLPRFNQLNVPFIERLRAAGVAPEDIDIVLCTHLHADHVGWNTCLKDGEWVPTFPNARYLFSRTENARWDTATNDYAGQPAGRSAVYNDSVLPVIRAGQATLLDGTHAIDDGLLVEPAPGHTPGHVILKLQSADQRGVFCGDVIHHPIQVYEPTWSTRFCELPEQAVVTRRSVLEYCADHGALLFPTHFAAPHVAAIETAADSFRPVFVPCQHAH